MAEGDRARRRRNRGKEVVLDNALTSSAETGMCGSQMSDPFFALALSPLLLLH